MPAARSSAISSSSRPISGPGGRPSSSPRRSGSAGSVSRAATTSFSSSGAPDEDERVERPRLGRPPEAVDRPRRAVLGRLRAEKGAGVALRLVRHRKALQGVAEDRDEAEGRTIDERGAVEPGARPVERRQEPELVGAAIAVDREPHELGQRPLARRLRHQPGVLAHETLRLRLQPEPELVLEPHRSQQPQRVVREDARRDRTEELRVDVGAAAEGVDRPRRPASGTAIALIVKSRVARSSSIVPGSGVKSTVRAVLERDPPGAVPLRERERRAAGALRVGARGRLRLAAGDVEVDQLAAEQLVANRAADDPRLLAGQDLLRELTHRGRPAARACGLELIPVDELVVDRVRHARMILEQHAVPDERDGRPDGKLAVELDGERVHRDRRRRRAAALPPTRTSAPVRSRRNPSA